MGWRGRQRGHVAKGSAGSDQMQEKLEWPAPAPAALLLLLLCGCRCVGKCKHSKERGAFGICAEREQEDREKNKQ